MSTMDFEKQLHSIASGMEYPPTPQIAGTVRARLYGPSTPRLMSRTLTRSLILALILLASLMSIPPVRAAVIEFIQIGVVRIFRTEPVPAPQQVPGTLIPVTATPAAPRPSLVPLLEKISGETTLAEARHLAGYPILLPAHPAGLDEPNRVFVQDANGPMTILVWMDAEQPDRVLMSLHFIPEGSWAVEKMGPAVLEETLVNGRRAVWAVGPYLVRLLNGDLEATRMVEGHVLIWESDDITYRLETSASLEEAIRIAESLEPIP